MFKKVMNSLLDPQRIVLKAWRMLGVGSFKTRLDYDIFKRPHYAYCLFHSARLAHLLGVRRISVVEFGVAGGSGLLELENLAIQVEKEFPVAIEIYGFDTGEGLPEPVDYRDIPFVWKAGFYKMDQELLRAKLKRSTLVLGDVKNTVPVFFETYDPAPLSAAFVDLDFWSSTVEALKIFDAPHDRILPRVYCYMDDVFGNEFGGLQNKYVGQLAAIREYNETNEMRKLAKISGFYWTRRVPAPWSEKIYIHHAFDHPQYCTYVHPDLDRQLEID